MVSTNDFKEGMKCKLFLNNGQSLEHCRVEKVESDKVLISDTKIEMASRWFHFDEIREVKKTLF